MNQFLIGLVIANILASSAAVGKDLYELIGVPKDASQKEVARAYRKQAIRLHPDQGGDREAFQELQSAYEVLIDPDRRTRYDQTGSVEEPVNSSWGFGRSAKESKESFNKDADEAGREYGNERWQYDSKTKSFLDKRTGFRSYMRYPKRGFYTDEGFKFSPSTGTYRDNMFEAYLEPDKDNKWYNYLGMQRRKVYLDMNTGLPESHKPPVESSSDASSLFIRWLNPKLNSPSNGGYTDEELADYRDSILTEMKSLPWTPEQRRDFGYKMSHYAHYFGSRDYGSRTIFDLWSLEVIYRNPWTKEFPSIIVSALPRVPPHILAGKEGREILHQEAWTNDPAFKIVYQQLFQHENMREYFINGLFASSAFGGAFERKDISIEKVRDFMPMLLEQANFLDVADLVFWIERTEIRDQIAKEMKQMFYTSQFVEALAHSTDKRREMWLKLLDWYMNVDPAQAGLYKSALESIPNPRPRAISSDMIPSIEQAAKKRISYIREHASVVGCSGLNARVQMLKHGFPSPLSNYSGRNAL